MQQRMNDNLTQISIEWNRNGSSLNRHSGCLELTASSHHIVHEFCSNGNAIDAWLELFLLSRRHVMAILGNLATVIGDGPFVPRWKFLSENVEISYLQLVSFVSSHLKLLQ